MNPNDAKSTFLLEHCAERCEGYQNDDACETCEINFAIKAIDKQIPRKPIGDLHSVPHYRCSVCYSSVKTYRGQHGVRFCRWCGQRILWEAEED